MIYELIVCVHTFDTLHTALIGKTLDTIANDWL